MCGIVGVVTNKETSASLTVYDALTMIQHRGQDSAGIATCDTNKLFLKKNNGLVRDVFHESDMAELSGNMGVGHVRYPTSGSSCNSEAQPFYVNSPYGIVLTHNGNLINTMQLTQELFVNDRRHLNTNSDSEVLLNIFAHGLAEKGMLKLEVEDVFSAVSHIHKRCIGAYACIGMILGFGVFAFRDPCGIRPLCFGRRESLLGVEYMFASESLALEALGFTLVRDVEPGEAIFIDCEGKLHARQCAEDPKLMPCIFEYVYLARPDSMMDKVSVYKARLRMGHYLANKIKQDMPEHDIDVVIPIPDTSRTSALPIA
ncbi:MAG: amidophosphoribosyltransferase, partial [Verrucomicrobiota bacterium]